MATGKTKKVLTPDDMTYIEGTVNSALVDGQGNITVPKNTYADIYSVTLTPGVWIINGGHSWTTSFNEMCIVALRIGTSIIDGAIIRYLSTAGGGINISTIYNATAQTTIKLSVYQTSSEPRIVRYPALKAIKIA